MNETQPQLPLDYAAVPAKMHVNPWAIVALVLSVVGVIVPVVGLVAIAGAAVARRQLAETPHIRGRTAARCAIVLGCIGTLISSVVVLAQLAHAAEANLMRCRNTMRSLGSVFALYATENRNQYPPDLAALFSTASIVPEVFICPSSGSPTDAIQFNDDLSARKAGHLEFVYLGEGLTLRSSPYEPVIIERFTHHYSSLVNVLYADGAVQGLSQDEALQLLERLRNTPRLTDEEYNFIVGK